MIVPSLVLRPHLGWPWEDASFVLGAENIPEVFFMGIPVVDWRGSGRSERQLSWVLITNYGPVRGDQSWLVTANHQSQTCNLHLHREEGRGQEAGRSSCQDSQARLVRQISLHLLSNLSISQSPGEMKTSSDFNLFLSCQRPDSCLFSSQLSEK